MFGETARISIMVDGDQRAMGEEKGTSPWKRERPRGKRNVPVEEVCLNFGIN